jgi:thiol-disulfide isomerase/thioredoxin
MQTRTIALIVVIIVIVVAIIGLQQLNPQKEAARKEISVLEVQNTTLDVSRIAMKTARYQKAIELVDPNGYINAEPFNLSDHIGKEVIFIDFWTYSCINCQRTFPFITAWDAKYRDEGLLIVGVHTPEFEFEKDFGNVKRATEKYGIRYPVVMDNDYKTWNAYRNRYWPRHYIIDIDGYIVDDHIGEGDYEETERKIQELLEERRQVLGLNMSVERNMTGLKEMHVRSATEEIYFGYAFARGHLGNKEGWQPEKIAQYVLPEDREQGKFYLEGRWKNNPDNMEAVGRGSVHLTYSAQSVNLVAGADTPTIMEVFIDGKHVENITVSDEDLYSLYASEFGTHELELRGSNVKLYTFTFG